MDGTTDHDLILRDNASPERNDSSSEAFLKDSSSPKSGGISKVSLRLLPFKSESFKAQSLLARFHSSRKSESGIKSDLKGSSGPWSSFSRGGRTPPKVGAGNFETSQGVGTVSDTEITSASLPDDLNQNSGLINYSSTKARDSSAAPSDDAEKTSAFACGEDAPFLSSEGQKSSESWFGTWPGRPRKLKSLKKRLLTSGTKNAATDQFSKTSERMKDGEETNNQVGTGSEKAVIKDREQNCKGKLDEYSELNLSNFTNDPAHHVSLDTLLESLPLVYDPTTRQLCVGSAKKGHNDKHNKSRMSKAFSPERSESSEDAQIENKEHIGSEVRSLDTEDESQKEALLKTYETGDSIISSKHLEIIQEVDESSESVRLIGKGTPQSGNVSGSSSLERGVFESPRNSLQRASTTNSLSITDASSFSSLSSSNTELSAYSASDSAVCLASHLSETSSLRDFPFGEGENKSKRKGITDFLTRNLFSWRHKDGGSNASDGVSSTSSSPIPSSPVSGTTSSSPGWRIFSRPSPRAPRSPDIKARNSELEAGSAGLIMENRPNNLPAKTAHEQLKHKQEYQQMVSAAKKKELREAKERKKAQANLQRQEEQLAAAVATWNNDFLPKWETMHTHKKCRELWWHGLPSCVRGKVWKMAIGNELNVTAQLYNIMVQRSMDKLVTLSECGSVASQDDIISDPGDQEATIDLIHLDVSRTFPHLCIFQKGGPYHDPLHHILGAYACYRPDVGYVQGMSFLAATLLLNMDESDAFIAFSNLLNRPAHMAFFRVDQPMMCAYYQTYEELLAVNLPSVAEHLKNIGVTPDLYILDWLLTVFSRPLPIDAAVRIWDVYLRDGEEFLFRAAIGILKLYETSLMNQECTATAAQFLTRLPEDLCVDALFRAISSVRTSAHKRTFSQILQAHMGAVAGSAV